MNIIDIAAHRVVTLLTERVETSNWTSLTRDSYRLAIDGWGRLFLMEKAIEGKVECKEGTKDFTADDDGLHEALSKLYEAVKMKIYLENEKSVYLLIETLKKV